MCMTKWKKTMWKHRILYGSKHRTFWQGQNCSDDERIRGCQRFKGRGGWRGRAQMIFKAVECSAWYFNGGQASLYIGLKPPNLQPRVNPIGMYRLWVITTCHCRFINYSKPLVWAANNGEGSVWGHRGIMGDPYHLLNVAVNLKLLEKIKSF